MEDLIKALQIFKKYMDEDVVAPLGGAYRVVYINPVVHKDNVSTEDTEELKKLGFNWDEYHKAFATRKTHDNEPYDN